MRGDGTIPMDESLLECDLDWFGVAPDGSLAHFATAGVGPVPVEFSGSVANYELVFDYFASLQPMSDIEVIEENLEEFANEEQRQRYLASFIAMSRKGLLSYDFKENAYILIVRPIVPMKYDLLPENIKNTLPFI